MLLKAPLVRPAFGKGGATELPFVASTMLHVLLEQTFEQALRAADALLCAEKTDDALKILSELASAYPDAVRVWELLARAHELRRDYAAAVEAYECVLSAVPDRLPALIAIAQNLVALGRGAEARWYAQQALDYDPANSVMRDIANERNADQVDEKRALFRQALARIKLGMTHRALRVLQAALGDEVEDRVDMRLTLARFWLQQGCRVAAADACMKVLDQNPDCLIAHAMLVTVWRAAGAANLERLHLTCLERLDPDHRLTNELMAELSPVPIADVPARPPVVKLPPAPALPEDWIISVPPPETRASDEPAHRSSESESATAGEWVPIEMTMEPAHESMESAAEEQCPPALFAPPPIATQGMAMDAEDEGEAAPCVEPVVWLPIEGAEAASAELLASEVKQRAELEHYLHQLRKVRGKALDALIAELERLLPQHSADAQWHELLGMAYARRGDSIAAIRAFQRAMELGLG
ncbi:MAG: tetratricopeptide repeat protein [Thermoflexales bacterium]